MRRNWLHFEGHVDPQQRENMPLNDWLKSALEKSGKRQADAARFLEAELGRPYYRTTIQKMLKMERKIQADELLALAKFTGIAAPRLDETDFEEEVRDYARRLDPQQRQFLLTMLRSLVGEGTQSPPAASEGRDDETH